MQNCNLDLLCVSKCRWTRSGRELSCNVSANLFWGKENAHSSYVALIANRSDKQPNLWWRGFASRFCNFSSFGVYMHLAMGQKKRAGQWWLLWVTANAVSKVPQHDMLLIIRDLNAKVRDDNSGKEDATTLENDFFLFWLNSRFFRATVRKNRAKSWFHGSSWKVNFFHFFGIDRILCR